MPELHLNADKIEQHFGDHVTDHPTMVDVTPVPMANSYDWIVTVLTIEDLESLQYAAASLGLRVVDLSASSNVFDDRWAGIAISLEEVAP